MTNEKTKLIAEQNDMFRKNLGMSLQDYIQGTPPGKYHTTSGIQNLGFIEHSKINNQVRNFDDFNKDNDPHGEHDLGRLEVNGNDILWKIDYYDTNYQYGSEDPSNLSKTRRVLTVMLTCEY